MTPQRFHTAVNNHRYGFECKVVHNHLSVRVETRSVKQLLSDIKLSHKNTANSDPLLCPALSTDDQLG